MDQQVIPLDNERKSSPPMKHQLSLDIDLKHVNSIQKSPIEPVHEIDEIVPNIFIGDYKSATDELLKQYNIGAIINIRTIDDIFTLSDIKYLQIDISDSTDIDITRYFVEAHRFIEAALSENKNVLIHC